jgi:hypothetical protein
MYSKHLYQLSFKIFLFIRYFSFYSESGIFWYDYEKIKRKSFVRKLTPRVENRGIVENWPLKEDKSKK